MSTPPNPLADMIREARLDAGLTQEELADRLKMSQEWLSRLERGGVQMPRPRAMRELARELSLDIGELYVAAGAAVTQAGGTEVAQMFGSTPDPAAVTLIADAARAVRWNADRLAIVLGVLEDMAKRDRRQREKA